MTTMRSASRAVLALAIVLLGSWSGVVHADDDDDDKPKTLAEKAAGRFPQPVVVGTLIGRAVLQPLESQPVLGRVRALVRGADGGIEVIVDYGGHLGYGTHPIAVPADAVALSGQFMEILDFTPAELDRFPVYGGGGTPLPDQDVIRLGLAKPSH